MAIERVKTRVEEGGHNIPEEVIKRRYSRGLENFFSIYSKMVDNWILYNFSSQSLTIVANRNSQKNIEIFNSEIFKKLENEYQK